MSCHLHQTQHTVISLALLRHLGSLSHRVESVDKIQIREAYHNISEKEKALPGTPWASPPPPPRPPPSLLFVLEVKLMQRNSSPGI